MALLFTRDRGRAFVVCAAGLLAASAAQAFAREARPRCRDVGIAPGILEPGQGNAITDVAGVRVGSVTVSEGDDVRTGVTVVLPHGGNVFQQKVPAAVHVGNGYGKSVGFPQVDELGTIETPIALTNTLNVGIVADAIVQYTLDRRGNEAVRSVNPVVGETNDGRLNRIRKRSVTRAHVFEALRKASAGPVAEGSVGAGTGTVAFGFKGGIGTASRRLPDDAGSYTVGALVQTNFGGILTVNGAPVGEALGRHYMKDGSDGSCMIVVATDAPVSPRNLKRMARRAMLGLARTGGFSSNGSGDFVIAFSTAPENRVEHRSGTAIRNVRYLRDDRMSPLFLAVVETVEEAIYNSLFRATKVCGRDGRCVEPLPLSRVVEICREHGAIREQR